jgi:hypothetical protein
MKKGKIDGNARKAWWAKFTGLLSLLSAISFIIASVPHADAEKFTSGTEEAALTPTLKTGDYVWKPAASPAGPVVIIVSIPDQSFMSIAMACGSGARPSAPASQGIARRQVSSRSFRKTRNIPPVYIRAHRCLICSD